MNHGVGGSSQSTGNDPDEIRGALMKANEEKDKPVLIIGKTVMGKGSLTESGE